MLRGSWISSMLKYNYLHFILYAASLLLIPILLGIIAARPVNIYPFLGIAVANLMILCKYIQRIKIEDDDIVVKKVFNVSSTNLEQSKLCVNSPLYIDTRLLWEQTIGSNSTQ